MNFRLAVVWVLLVILSCAHSVPTTSRIVGGSAAVVGQFPYQVSLQRDSYHFCGGSILNERYILTAAHCVVVGEGYENYPAKYFSVRVGSIQRSAGGQLLQIKRIVANKGYGSFLNDIALLELEKPLVFTANIQPIEMADADVPTGEDVVVSGWGRLYTDGPNPQRLQWDTLKALNTQECDEAIQWGYESLICLTSPVGQGICFDDSGGPATYNGKLVGVAAFVLEGCASKNPDGYSKVFYHRDWILENMI